MKIKSISRRTEYPSIYDKASNFMSAIKRQLDSGAHLAPKSVRDSRSGICSECPMWSKSGNLWLGECRHKKCGCTKFKRFFLNETCPLNKW